MSDEESKATKNLKPSYRLDLDGLRGMAVLFVILYHFKFAIPGGFIGVDIFLVLSGYLITRIINSQLDKNAFNLLDFWRRRTMRILPACFVMVIATLAVGFFLLFPTEYENCAKSALASISMVANVFFWRTSNYFTSDSESLPLLHLWSLSVEFQFYLAFPVVLRYLKSRFPNILTHLLLTAILVFTLLSEWMAIKLPTANYYSPLARAPEFLVGSLVCFLPRVYANKRGWMEGLAILGLCMILYSGFSFTTKTRFPGLAALVPCLGAGFIIYSNEQRMTSVGRLLSNVPLIWTGRVSYSLYLWHWPVLVFFRTWFGSPLSLILNLVAILIVVALSVLSYKFLEKPFLEARLPISKGVRSSTALVGITLLGILISLSILAFDGLPNRYDSKLLGLRYPELGAFSNTSVKPEDVLRGTVPLIGRETGPIDCLIWGDSHAMAMSQGLARACELEGFKGAQVTYSSTPPLINFVASGRYSLMDQTPAYAQSVVDLVDRLDIPLVFLVSYWSTIRQDQLESSLQSTIEKLQSTGAKVVVVYQVCTFPFDVPSELSRLALQGRPVDKIGVPDSEYRTQVSTAPEILLRVAQRTGAMLYDPGEFLRDENGVWVASKDDFAIYRDRHHLSKSGALLLAPLFSRVLTSTIPERQQKADASPSSGQGSTEAK